MEKHNPKAPEDVTFIREKTYTDWKCDVNNAGGGGAPIERENEGGMDHFMAIENIEKKRQRRRKIYITRK